MCGTFNINNDVDSAVEKSGLNDVEDIDWLLQCVTLMTLTMTAMQLRGKMHVIYSVIWTSPLQSAIQMMSNIK